LQQHGLSNEHAGLAQISAGPGGAEVEARGTVPTGHPCTLTTTEPGFHFGPTFLSLPII